MTKQHSDGRYEVYNVEGGLPEPRPIPAGRYENLEDAKAHANSVTYRMAVVDKLAESRGFIFCNWEANDG